MTTVKNLLDYKGNTCWSVSPETTVFEALQIMAKKEIGAVIVTKDDVLVGIFSERDYARKLILKNHFSKESLVGDFMTKDVVFVNTETGILECMKLMTEKHIRHLPVLENGKLSGIITIGDVVNEIIIRQKNKIDDLENYIFGGDYGVK